MSALERWRLIPRLLLRRAGFPFDLISQLALPKVALAAAAAAESEAEAEVLRTQLLTRVFPEAVKVLADRQDRAALKQISALRRRIGRKDVEVEPSSALPPLLSETIAQWVAARRRANEGHAGLERAVALHLPEAFAALQKAISDEQVKDAIFLLVPAVVTAIEDHPISDGDRAQARRLYSFIQRLASKNETTSFFGPLTHARVNVELPQASFGPETDSGVRKREAFAAFWAVAAFADAAARDPALRPHLPIRRIPAAAVDGEQAWAPDGSPATLSETARRVFRHVDDVATASELVERLALPPAEVEQALRALERGGFVRRDLEPASTDHHPLEDLRRRIPAVAAGQKWLAAIESFTGILQAFAGATRAERQRLLTAAEKLFEDTTGKSPHRGAGQMYADRTVLFEDCQGDLDPVELGRGEAELIENALTPALQLGATYGAHRHQAVVTLATTVLADRRMRFSQFAAELDQRISWGELDPLDEPARQWLRALTERVRGVSDGHVARLTSEGLADLVSDAGVRFASPDVMVAQARDGRLSAVIGEVHPYVFAWGSQNYFAPDAEALRAAFARDLRPWGGRERMAVVLRRRKHKGLVSDEFPGAFIEVTARSVDDRTRRIAIGDLWVEPDKSGRPALMGPRGPLTLYVGEDDHPHLRVFAPPLVEMPKIRLGEHTPRVEIDGLVFQRERWELNDETLQLASARGWSELYLRTAIARRRDGWPRWVFASAPSEPKPLCLDLDVPFALHHLQHLLSKGPVTLVEMVPSPDQLWLQRRPGGFTSELRLGMLREG